MKSNFKILLSLLVFVMLMSSSVFAQNMTKAELTPENGIVLSGDNSVQGQYEIDIADFNWSEEFAKEKAISLSEQSEFIYLELDYPNQKIILSLFLDAPEVLDWTKEMWDTHVSTVQ